MPHAASIHHILRQHFIRRLLDNDLISPETDRHEVLVMVAASLAVPGLMITVVLLGQKYVIGIPTPGLTAIAALDDKFLYITASMLITALMAAFQWDSLALDARDTANLGPLPITARVIGTAQLSAMAIFVTSFAIALNGVPSILFPLLTVSHFHVGILAVVGMVAVHAAVTMAAGAYAFLTVLLVREALRLALTPDGFRRISGTLQALLVVTLGSTLLLLPWLATNVSKWFPTDRTVHVVPPIWFLGLYESGTHDIALQIRGLGLRIPASVAVREQQARASYDALTPRLGELGITAVVMLCATAAAALVLYTWNNRRLPPPPITRQSESSDASRFVVRLVGCVLVPHPLARGGFFFTLQTLARSVPHRMSLAAAVAVALAGSVVTIHNIPMHQVGRSALIPVKLLALQPVVITIVLAGARHAMHVPAELRANWMFQMAWRGDVRPFLTGVKRAVMIAICIPVLLVLLVPNVFVLGPLGAISQFACGVLVGAIVLELFLLGSRKLPFTCSAMPLGHLKGVAPIYLMLVIFVAVNFGQLERVALGNTRTTVLMLCLLAVLYDATRLLSQRQQRRRPELFEFDELPDLPTQRLGLSENV